MRGDARPDPAALLAKVKEQESQAGRGRLKIFLGAVAGVGKTYAMLQSAQKLKQSGVDVVAGCVVTHGREDTQVLLQGLETIPLKRSEYNGKALEEFDLDAVLVRKPGIVLVDELAHTNVPGARHKKRWQDVDELIDAGISVYTTLNVQHLESLNDIVAQITGIKVRETIPDSILERAQEVTLVDLPPDDLIQRLKDGKVYLPEKTENALHNFFRKGNLIALRELALRATAERVETDMNKYRSDEAIDKVWPASENILVCVSPSPLSARLIRAARRMAASLHAKWHAVYIESTKAQLSESARNNVIQNLKFAEQLGASTTTLSGSNIAEELVSYARRLNISKIVIGKPAKPRLIEILFGSVVDDLIRCSGDIDIYVITGDLTVSHKAASAIVPKRTNYKHYLFAFLGVMLVTLIDRAMQHLFATVNLVMIYLVLVTIIATRYGRGPSILASILSVACFDFFFVPPYFSFAVTDGQYLLTLLVMLGVGLTLSTLTTTVKNQAELARLKERQTAALYAMSKEQASTLSMESVVIASVKHIKEVFDTKVTVFLADEQNELKLLDKLLDSFEINAHELGVAQWVYINRQVAGLGTATLPGAHALYLPLIGSRRTMGVLGMLPADPKRLQNPLEMHLLETFVNQIGLAVERAYLSEQAETAKNLADTVKRGMLYDSPSDC